MVSARLVITFLKQQAWEECASQQSNVSRAGIEQGAVLVGRN